MKRFLTVFMVCCMCALSLAFSGCGEDFSAEQILERYNKIKQNTEVSHMFDSNHFLKVSYDSSVINLSDGVEDNPLRIVFDIYEPVLVASSQFLLTKLNDLEVQSLKVLEAFDKDSRNRIYRGLDELETQMLKFDAVKQRFDKSDGQLMDIFLREYNRFISSVINLTNVFGESYYNAFMNQNYDVLIGPIADAILYSKGVCAEIFFEYYVLNMTLETPPQSIAKWEEGFVNFGAFKDFATSLNLGGAVTESDRVILTALKEEHDEFLAKYSVFKRSIKDIDYKEYYYNTVILNRDKEDYLESLSLMQKSILRSSEEFISSSFAEFWQRTKSLQY